MTEERIITSATITSGEKPDGKELETLIAKSKEAGVDIDTVIGDAAYSEKDNIIYTKDSNIKLVARLSESVTHGSIKNKWHFKIVSIFKKSQKNAIKLKLKTVKLSIDMGMMLHLPQV